MKNTNKKTAFLILALALGLLFTLTACTDAKTENSAKGNGNAQSQTENVNAAADDKNSEEQTTGNGKGNEQLALDTIQSGTLTEPQKELTISGYGSKGALADNNLSIADMLMYAAQDEFAARGEYAAIIEKFGSQNPYANIIKSEESHIAALQELYAAYGLGFPEDTSELHVVNPSDLKEAAQTGVQAEIDNIAMYDKFLSYELPEQIKSVFEQLKKASESHLNAFQKQVDKL